MTPLENQNIILRLVELDDLALRVQWINDLETNAMLGFDWPVSLDKTRQWFHMALTDQTKIHFTILHAQNGPLIGMAGFLGIDYKNRHAETYITLGNKDYRGKGLAPVVLDLLSQYAFEMLGLERLYAYNIGDNVPSQKSFERAGYLKEGTLRCHRFKNGRFQDVNIYGLMKAEWQKLRDKANVT